MVLPSPFEQMAATDYVVEDMMKLHNVHFRKKALILVACKKCGKKAEHILVNPCEVELEKGL